MTHKTTFFIFCWLLILTACNNQPSSQEVIEQTPNAPAPVSTYTAAPDFDESRPDIYASVRLTADLKQLTDKQRQMIVLFVEAAQIMDELFWQQAFGDKDALLQKIDDPRLQRFARINYGPWDRLNANRPFLSEFGDKPKGANFYPTDMTAAEYDALENPAKADLYTLLRRNDAGQLTVVPYQEAYAEPLQRAAQLLEQAADLAENKSLKNYLRLRAKALLDGDFYASDSAWLDMKDNQLDFIIGPIETYEDQRFGQKAAYEAYILIKDMRWSKKLEKFTQLLPQLQRQLPVADKYKQEEPGTDSQLNAYDVIYYAGDCNAGSKTIAVNLPNDEQLQLEKGTRRSQLKNAMQAKFDQIMRPITDLLIDSAQRQHVTFSAFFDNTMYHEVAHGLGIKNVVGQETTVREALKDYASSIEEGKADVLGLFLVTKLREMKEITEGELMDNYVTFMAGIFRSVRFGATSAHGRANMIRFNFFKEQGAFVRQEDGTYKVNPEKMQTAVAALSQKILALQGDGDYEGAKALTEEMGVILPDLQADLDRLTDAQIPVDVVFEQGLAVLGLE